MKNNYSCIRVLVIILLFPITVPILLLSSLGKAVNSREDSNTREKRHDKENTYSEEEMDFFGLTKYEKEEVRKGNYRPDQFSEPEEGDELDSDDYYYDE